MSSDGVNLQLGTSAVEYIGRPRTLLQGFIKEAAQRVLDGQEINYDEALKLIYIDNHIDLMHLLAWANQIRIHYHQDRIRLCSIINVKSGGCPEDCKFCAQSAFNKTSIQRYELLPTNKVAEVAQRISRLGIKALGIVAAWQRIPSHVALEQVCEQIRTIAKAHIEPHASLGMISDFNTAKRLADSGLICYNHNLETSRRFFPNVCTTHTYEDRIRTVRLAQTAGIRVCCGGIIGMGEQKEDRIQLALQLRSLQVDTVPLNILNPIPGTPLEHTMPLPPLESLKTIACFRFILPRQRILLAGGRAVNLRDLQATALLAGANAMIVGNYLTTLNRPVDQDLQMVQDLQLELE